MLVDRSYNYEDTWMFVDKVYDLNNGIYNTLSQVYNIFINNSSQELMVLL
jgi:hypothetical protein